MTFDGIDEEMDIEKLRAKARELAIRNLSIEGENEILLAEVTRLTKLLAEAKDKGVQLALGLQIKRLNEQIAAKNRELFGLSRTERRKPEENKPEETSKPKRPGHGPNKQEKLPHTEERHTLDEPDMVCPNCEPAVPLKEWEGQTEDTVQVTLVERKIKLVQHKCQKYKCPICGHIDSALGPKPLVPGGRYAPEFGVAVAVDKYSEHLPLERQVVRFGRLGLQVTSATLWDQLAGLYQLLLPSYLALQDLLLELPVLGADESPWRVMGKGRSERWWVWALVGPDAVFYQVAPTRGTAAARALLKDYDGVLMADGYSVYKSLEAAGQEPTQAQLVDLDGADLPTPRYTLVTCWMHARRGLIHAEKNHSAASHALDLIGALYAVEARAVAEAEGDPDRLLEVRRRLRDAESRPIIDQLRTWLDAQKPIPRLKLDDAVTYLRNHWKWLTRFLDAPRVPLDNGASERRMRGPVLGRKNHYGSRSEFGTRVAALFYSLIETCKMLGIDPGAYLLAACRRAMDTPGAKLLPHTFAQELAAQRSDEGSGGGRDG